VTSGNRKRLAGSTAIPSCLEEYLAPRTARIHAALDQYLPATDSPASRLVESMRYSVFAGGKRLRPLLCVAAAEACGGNIEGVVPAACALELIHTFSLIHDDLPSIDNDALRRGIPACHIEFGEGLAMLAGDALLARAFELVAEQARLSPPEKVVVVLRVMSQALGPDGMAGGQAADIVAEQTPEPGVLEFIHTRKTGALLRSSTLIGGILAGANDAECDALGAFGAAVGLALQITDDLLDVRGNPVTVGKALRKDQDKITYPRLLGIDGAQQAAEETIQEALRAISGFDARAAPLRAIALSIAKRVR
jgi:geranylgeranyl diphosphate synthase type II